MEKAAQKVAALLQERRIQTLVLPWRRDPHPDHIATTAIGQLAIQYSTVTITTLEYPVWLWKNGAPPNYPKPSEILPFRLNIRQVYATKWKATNCHQSQLGLLIHDSPYGFTLTAEILEDFKGDYEFFFAEKQTRKPSLPKSYFDALYAESADPWNFKHSTYEQQKYHTTIQALSNKSFKNGLELGCSIGVLTRLLATQCDALLAVDISAIAIKQAQDNCRDLDQVRFKALDVNQRFPEGKFDLIICSEICYYLDKEALQHLFKNITQTLTTGGTFVMVHWTGLVPDYPLTGDAVHEYFQAFIRDNTLNISEITAQRYEKYRLQVWQKG
jgi:SAM-dependent methyltransferase